MKQYHEITILHVIACMMILLCHFFQDAKLSGLGEIFLSGLSLFFIISGFLTGLKPITDGYWVKCRLKRILIPYYMALVIFLLAIYCFTDEFRLWDAAHLISVTQGLNYIYWPYHGYGALSGLGHLWYITVILLCFVLTPVLNKVYNRINFGLEQWYIAIAVLICIVQPLLISVGIQSSYIISFLIGFIFAKFNYNVTLKRWFCVGGIFVLISVIRLAGRHYIDGTIMYDRYIALVSQGAMGFMVFATVFMFGSLAKNRIRAIARSGVVLLIASVIYEIYLLHYFFLRGPWPIKNYVDNIVIADILVAILSISVGLVLSKANKVIQSKAKN